MKKIVLTDKIEAAMLAVEHRMEMHFAGHVVFKCRTISHVCFWKDGTEGFKVKGVLTPPVGPMCYNGESIQFEAIAIVKAAIGTDNPSNFDSGVITYSINEQVMQQ